MKVLNSYFNLTFHCTDHRALCKVFLHERVYTENQNGLYRPQFGVVDIECSCKPVVSAIYCGIQSNDCDYRFTERKHDLEIDLKKSAAIQFG